MTTAIRDYALAAETARFAYRRKYFLLVRGFPISPSMPGPRRLSGQPMSLVGREWLRATAFGFGTQTQYVLDCITLAVEADFFTSRETLKSYVFATEDDFDAFCTALTKYDWWLNERHFYAFAVLLDADEFSIRTYAELAQEFRDEYAKY